MIHNIESKYGTERCHETLIWQLVNTSSQLSQTQNDSYVKPWDIGKLHNNKKGIVFLSKKRIGRITNEVEASCPAQVTSEYQPKGDKEKVETGEKLALLKVHRKINGTKILEGVVPCTKPRKVKETLEEFLGDI